MDQLLAKISELTLLNKDKDEQRDEGLSEASKRVTPPPPVLAIRV